MIDSKKQKNRRQLDRQQNNRTGSKLADKLVSGTSTKKYRQRMNKKMN